MVLFPIGATLGELCVDTMEHGELRHTFSKIGGRGNRIAAIHGRFHLAPQGIAHGQGRT